MNLSPNTQSILLLTAPLISKGGSDQDNALKPAEYKKLARLLLKLKRQPADFLGPQVEELIEETASVVEADRARGLLGRGFALAQALDRWEQRSIWVVSRADAHYPSRLKKRLGEDAPPVLYGVGHASILEQGGLAIVGSRKVDGDLLGFAEDAARLAAQAGKPVVSGGARGVDQAAMRGAGDEGGMVAGVLADSLERAAVKREHRQPLMEGQMVLISPYDPAAGFNVGHAMQRNKLIYALADAALVVNADLNKGGTWAGAVEQLEKLRFVPVFVRASGPPSRPLEALKKKGAQSWPEPRTPDELQDILAMPFEPRSEAQQLSLSVQESNAAPYQQAEAAESTNGELTMNVTPAEALMARVRDLVMQLKPPFTAKTVAEDLNITETQAREWLNRLAENGSLEKLSRPVRYRPKREDRSLFE
ncbi:MAG: DNA-processing protein DprA [Bacteroidota bacterium]